MPSFLRNFLPSALLALAVTARFPAHADLAVYSDSLVNDFHDWNSAAHNLTNSSPVHSGNYSISVNATSSWQGISFYHDAMDSSPYASFNFWANGGAEGGQRIQVQGALGSTNPPRNVYYRTTLATAAWQEISVPLAAIGAADQTNLTAIWIQLIPTGATNPFYVDDVRFIDKHTPAPVVAPTPAAALATNAAVPVPTVVVIPPAAHATWWIAGALGVIIALLGWMIAVLTRRTVEPTTALVRAAANTAPPSSNPSAAPLASAQDVQWKERALAAEALAAQQAQVLRERVCAELVEFAKGALVQGLYTQRSMLLETQRKAQLELVELETRLTALRLPIAERILAYECRIAELEKELGTRGEEMRELIRATLLLVRQKLEQERELENRSKRFN